MSVNRGYMVIGHDMALTGEIRNGKLVEVHGLLDGHLASESVVVHPSGRVKGTLRAGSAKVNGAVEGIVQVKNLIEIGSTGRVTGQVQYGQMAMQVGGILTAEVRNIPPTLAGDFEITVLAGKSVALTRADLAAVDPDSSAIDLRFAISNLVNGSIMLSGGSGPQSSFTQADLDAGRVFFVHDGTPARKASFDVVVTDQTGASSGRPQTVLVTVAQPVG